MKAVTFYEHGGPEVLRYEDVADPEPAPEQVVIRVRAVSVNRTLDIEVRQRGAGWPIPMPHILGADPAGEVVALGTDVTNVRLGDRVVTFPLITCRECIWCRSGREHGCERLRLVGVHVNGGYAECVAVPARNLIRIPERLSFEEASAMSLYYPAAWNLLAEVAQVRPGETVLVMAAGSGLGVAGIVLAKHLGARVIAAAGADWKLEKAKELGADEVVNYCASDLPSEVRRLTGGLGADVVFENIGSPELWPKSIASLSKFGRLVTCGTHGGGRVELDVRYVYRSHFSLRGTQGATWPMVQRVFKLAESGAVRPPVIDRRFPLSEAALAHQYVAGRNNFGRVTLVV